jgi:hypothetical protein
MAVIIGVTNPGFFTGSTVEISAMEFVTGFTSAISLKDAPCNVHCAAQVRAQLAQLRE